MRTSYADNQPLFFDLTRSHARTRKARSTVIKRSRRRHMLYLESQAKLLMGCTYASILSFLPKMTHGWRNFISQSPCNTPRPPRSSHTLSLMTKKTRQIVAFRKPSVRRAALGICAFQSHRDVELYVFTITHYWVPLLYVSPGTPR